MSSPKICPFCHYVNPPKLQYCSQCYGDLEHSRTDVERTTHTNPRKLFSPAQEYAQNFNGLGVALLLFLSVVAYFLTTLQEISLPFVALFFGAGILILFLCFKKTLWSLLFLLPFQGWFCVFQNKLLLQPTWFSYLLISLLVLMGFFELNLFYYCVIQGKTRSFLKTTAV